MKHRLIYILLLFYSGTLFSQSFRKGIIRFNLFDVNDTTKYFEIVTPTLEKDSVMCGVLIKQKNKALIPKYIEPFDACLFKVTQNVYDTIQISFLNTEKDVCYKLDENIEGTYYQTSNITKQVAFKFPRNYKSFFIAQNSLSIKLYEYPSYNSKFTLIGFTKGDRIEERWRMGIAGGRNLDSLIWGNYIYCDGKKKGWFLLSDIYKSFKVIKNKKQS